jgi:hypothetical protein
MLLSEKLVVYIVCRFVVVLWGHFISSRGLQRNGIEFSSCPISRMIVLVLVKYRSTVLFHHG